MTEEIGPQTFPWSQSVMAPTWRSAAECCTALGIKQRPENLGRRWLKVYSRAWCNWAGEY